MHVIPLSSLRTCLVPPAGFLSRPGGGGKIGISFMGLHVTNRGLCDGSSFWLYVFDKNKGEGYE